MVRQTSKEVYEKIRNEGLLSKMRFKVYREIFRFGPITASEVFAISKMKTNQSGRFTELEELGVIQAKETRICSETGRKAIAWEVTNKLPQKPEKKVRYISIAEAEKMLNKNRKIHYIIRREGLNNQLNLEI